MAENITLYLVLVLCVNAFLFMGQIAIMDINPESATNFYNSEGSLFKYSDSGNYTHYADASDYMPQSVNSVSTEGTTYTDDFTTARGWLLENTGAGYVIGILSAPYSFLKSIGLPDAFTFMLGTLWYGITLFLFVSFLFGRQT